MHQRPPPRDAGAPFGALSVDEIRCLLLQLMVLDAGCGGTTLAQCARRTATSAVALASSCKVAWQALATDRDLWHELQARMAPGTHTLCKRLLQSCPLPFTTHLERASVARALVREFELLSTLLGTHCARQHCVAGRAHFNAAAAKKTHRRLGALGGPPPAIGPGSTLHGAARVEVTSAREGAIFAFKHGIVMERCRSEIRCLRDETHGPYHGVLPGNFDFIYAHAKMALNCDASILVILESSSSSFFRVRAFRRVLGRVLDTCPTRRFDFAPLCDVIHSGRPCNLWVHEACIKIVARKRGHVPILLFLHAESGQLSPLLLRSREWDDAVDGLVIGADASPDGATVAVLCARLGDAHSATLCLMLRAHDGSTREVVLAAPPHHGGLPCGAIYFTHPDAISIFHPDGALTTVVKRTETEWHITEQLCGIAHERPLALTLCPCGRTHLLLFHDRVVAHTAGESRIVTTRCGAPQSAQHVHWLAHDRMAIVCASGELLTLRWCA